MAEYEVKAILSAEDKNYTSTMQKALGLTGGLTSKMKKYVGIGAAVAIGQRGVSAAMNTVSNSMGSAIKRYDQLNRFPQTLKNLGIGADEAKKATDELSKGIDGLPTTLDSATAGVSRLVSSNGDIKKSTKYFLAMNNAIIAGGGSAEIQASAIEQLSQSYSKGKMDMMEWRSLQTAMPGQLNQIAKAMGKSTDELGEGLRKGTISMDDFMNTMVQLNDEGVAGFSSFSEQAMNSVGGIETSMSLIQSAVTRGIANCIGSIDKMLQANGFPKISGIAIKVRDAVNEAFKGIQAAIEKVDLKGIVASATPYWNAFVSVAKGVGAALKTVGNFLLEHSATITKVLPVIGGLVLAFKGYQVVNSLVGPLKTFSGIMVKISKSVTGLAEKLFGTAAGQEAVKKSSRTTAKQITASANAFMKLGVAVLAIGAGILLAGAGLWIIANAAIKLAGAGGPAIAVMFGMVAALAALGYAASLVGKALTVGAAGFVAFGLGLALAGAGVWLMCNGIAKIAALGGPAIATLFGMVAAIAALAAVFAVLGVALTAGAVGILAFGAAMLMVGAGVALVGAGILMIGNGIKKAASALPILAKNGKGAAKSITQIGEAAAGLKLSAIIKLAGLAGDFIKLGKGAKTAGSSLKTIVGSAKAGTGAIKTFGTNAKTSLRTATTAVKDFLKSANKIKNIKGKVTIKSKLPKYSVSWTEHKKGKTTAYTPKIKAWATGAIFRGASLLNGNNLVGEAGPEAVAPISKLQDYVGDAVRENVGFNYDVLAEKIASALADVNLVSETYFDSKKIAETVAKPIQEHLKSLEVKQSRLRGTV